MIALTPEAIRGEQGSQRSFQRASVVYAGAQRLFPDSPVGCIGIAAWILHPVAGLSGFAPSEPGSEAREGYFRDQSPIMHRFYLTDEILRPRIRPS